MPPQAGGAFSLGVAQGGDDVGVFARGKRGREGGRGYQQRRELHHPARRRQCHLSGILQAGARGSLSPPFKMCSFSRVSHVYSLGVCVSWFVLIFRYRARGDQFSPERQFFFLSHVRHVLRHVCVCVSVCVFLFSLEVVWAVMYVAPLPREALLTATPMAAVRLIWHGGEACVRGARRGERCGQGMVWCSMVW